MRKCLAGRRARLAVVGTAAVGVLCMTGVPATAPAAGAGTTSATPANASPAKLAVTVRIEHLTVAGRLARASALATATLTSAQGAKTTARQQVALTAATSSGCEVLHLYLQQLDLNLLGLIATLDKVNLDVVGHASGGVLGSLFCKLSKGVTGKIASISTARSLNAQLAAHSPVLRFAAQLSPQTRATQTPTSTGTSGTGASGTAATGTTGAPGITPGSCQVLNLILGPLNLTLLGLEVDLNQIHLDVTADPAGGALGSLFCSLTTAKLTV
jgi:hypothetical protein